jgi:hypothetical protein
VTLESARQRAIALDSKTERQLADQPLGPPMEVFRVIRAYLLRRSEETDQRNNLYALLKIYTTNDLVQIDLGPPIDKGPTDSHFRFDSGARLCFGLTLCGVEDRSRLVAFRYHYTFPDGHSVKFLRFDLNDEVHPDPLAEPRCHLHPGTKDLRLPFSVHHPIEILDRIFFVLEKAIAEKG